MKPFRTPPPSRANSARDAWLIFLTTSCSIPAKVQNLSSLCWNRRLSPVPFHWQEAKQGSRLSPAEKDGACFHYRRCVSVKTKGRTEGRCRTTCLLECKRFKIEWWSFSRGCWFHGSTWWHGKRQWLHCLSLILLLARFSFFSLFNAASR